MLLWWYMAVNILSMFSILSTVVMLALNSLTILLLLSVFKRLIEFLNLYYHLRFIIKMVMHIRNYLLTMHVEVIVRKKLFKKIIQDKIKLAIIFIF